MKITVRNLKRLIREAAPRVRKPAGKFVAATYDVETGAFIWFTKGDQATCQAAAEKMAALIGTELLSSPEEVESQDILDSNGAVAVLPMKHELLSDEAGGPRTVQEMNGQLVCSYELGEDEDETYFAPEEGKTKFKAGDKIILAIFSGSGYGGWTVTDVNLTFQEFWALSDVEDELESDEGPDLTRLTTMEPDGKIYYVDDGSEFSEKDYQSRKKYLKSN